MKVRFRIALITGLLISCLYACVAPYDVKYQLNADILIIDGFVSDQLGTTVSIDIGRNANKSYYSEAVKGCVTEIRAGDGSTIPLQETEAGVYTAPSNFKGKIGQTYQLHFRTSDGKTYESPKELLKATAEIKNVYQQYDPIGILDNNGNNVIGSTVDIYLDFDDPKETQNFYLWRWKLYEEQSICLTCIAGKLDPVSGKCVRIYSVFPPDYDYSCDGQCWDLFYNKNLNIFSDNFSNGKSISGRLIAKIPFYSSNGGALLEIEQLGISQQAYQYFRLLSDQAQTTGTLVDTPPAAIIGNIRNVNDSQEKTVGFFGAASSKKVLHWVERDRYPNPIVTSLLGRPINREMPVTPPFPPSFPCLLSKNRTPVRPEGWR